MSKTFVSIIMWSSNRFLSILCAVVMLLLSGISLSAAEKQKSKRLEDGSLYRYPLLDGLIVGVDLFQPVVSLFGQQYANYQVSRTSIDLINQKYHDLKHQIEFLKMEISEKDKIAYLNKMEKEIQQYEAENKTGNRILDTILTTKSLNCQEKNIQMTCVADGKALDFVNPMDICSIFGNALDNAITSAEKVENPERRLIHVTVSQEKSFLRIKIENSFQGVLKMKNQLPITTKEDRRYLA